MESYLVKRKLNVAEREPPAGSPFVPAVALGYEYDDAAAEDQHQHQHQHRRVAASEMDFFKKEKRERKDAAADKVQAATDDLRIKEDDLTINVRLSIPFILPYASQILVCWIDRSIDRRVGRFS